MNIASIIIFAIVVILFAAAVRYLRRHGQCAACSGREGSCPAGVAGKCRKSCCKCSSAHK
jgi:hypothetical protein